MAPMRLIFDQLLRLKIRENILLVRRKNQTELFYADEFDKLARENDNLEARRAL